MDINPLELLKDAHKIQEQMSSFQKRLIAINVTGSAGGGMVEVDLNGKFEVSAARISPTLMESGDTEMLQDLIVAAFSNGHKKIQDALNQKVGEMAGGLGIPNFNGLMGAS